MKLLANDAVAHTRIKFCGMTRMDDVRLAGELGADAIGLIFAARSLRCVSIGQALELRDAAAPTTSAVALVMDNRIDEVERIVGALRPDILQFHGGEDDAFCARFGIPFLKALPMREVATDAIPSLLARYPSASGFVFDGHAPGAMGGSGERFDWSRLSQQHLARPWLLAGGLDATNVGAAIRIARPWGVDVSSGVESAPGTKNAVKMRSFVDAVRRADELQDREARETDEQR